MYPGVWATDRKIKGKCADVPGTAKAQYISTGHQTGLIVRTD